MSILSVYKKCIKKGVLQTDKQKYAQLTFRTLNNALCKTATGQLSVHCNWGIVVFRYKGCFQPTFHIDAIVVLLQLYQTMEMHLNHCKHTK